MEADYGRVNNQWHLILESGAMVKYQDLEF